jgi:Zn-finger nucleic acid-binding protein
MNCSACAAMLPLDSIRCANCATLNPVDLLAIGRHEFVQALADRACPNGHGPLHALRFAVASGFHASYCRTCMGMFVAHDELDKLLVDISGQVVMTNHGRLRSIRQHLVSSARTPERPCPCCRTTMRQTQFAPECPVLLDTCERHGQWLDGGELTVLAEWQESGGIHLPLASAGARQRLVRAMDEDRPGDPPLPPGFWPLSTPGRLLRVLQVLLAAGAAWLALQVAWLFLQT